MVVTNNGAILMKGTSYIELILQNFRLLQTPTVKLAMILQRPIFMLQLTECLFIQQQQQQQQDKVKQTTALD